MVIEGLLILTNKNLIGVRDPFGIRPLVIGKLDKSYVLASETCAFDIIGAKFIREVKNGEIVIINENLWNYINYSFRTICWYICISLSFGKTIYDR